MTIRLRRMQAKPIFQTLSLQTANQTTLPKPLQERLKAALQGKLLPPAHPRLKPPPGAAGAAGQRSRAINPEAGNVLLLLLPGRVKNSLSLRESLNPGKRTIYTRIPISGRKRGRKLKPEAKIPAWLKSGKKAWRHLLAKA